MSFAVSHLGKESDFVTGGRKNGRHYVRPGFPEFPLLLGCWVQNRQGVKVAYRGIDQFSAVAGNFGIRVFTRAHQHWLRLSASRGNLPEGLASTSTRGKDE